MRGIDRRRLLSAEFAAESVSALGYVRPEYTQKLAEIIDEAVEGAGSGLAAREYRKAGQQVGPAFRQLAGIKSRGAISVDAWSMLTERGRQNPVRALETTVRRAAFNVNRAMRVHHIQETARQLDQHPTCQIISSHHDCRGCRDINRLVVATPQSAFDLILSAQQRCEIEVCAAIFKLVLED